MSVVMKRAFWVRVPARRPRVSRFEVVFCVEWDRKEGISGLGRKIVRRGVPDSRVDVVRNWWVSCGGEVGVLEGRGGGEVVFEGMGGGEVVV